VNYGHGIVVDEILIEKVEPVYSVIINVTDGIDPISGALVTFNDAHLQSNELGEAVFNEIPLGADYDYSVNMSGYNSVGGQMDVNDHVQLEVVLNISTAVAKNTMSDILVYPNPSDGVFSLLQGSIAASMHYELFNVSGLRVQKGVFEKSLNKIDMSMLPEGVYILRLVWNHNERIMKLVIKR